MTEVYYDDVGRLRSRTVCQCSHHIDSHEGDFGIGACLRSDDDGDGHFDPCGCDEFRERFLT